MSDYEARRLVYLNFRAWQEAGLPVGAQSAGIKPYNDKTNHLAWLLGRAKRFPDEMSEAEVAACHALSGPHGYSYYRMLLARRCADG